MTKLKKSLYLTLAFMLLMIVLGVFTKLDLNTQTLPEDDVELRVLGAWIVGLMTISIVGSFVVFITSYLTFNLIGVRRGQNN